MNKKQKRQCAVCGDKTQANVKLKWKRNSDNTVFHVCMLCAESNKVNENSVVKKCNNTYTTYIHHIDDLEANLHLALPNKPKRPFKKPVRYKN